MKELVIRLKGGLGNQLFCYAAGKRLALANGAEVLLDTTTGFKRDKIYRRTFAIDRFSICARHYRMMGGLYVIERLARHIQREIEQKLPVSERRLIEQNGVQFDPDLLRLRLKEGENYFDGFGQSEDYFADIKDIIKSDLAIPAPTVPLVLEFKDEIVRTRSIGIHVRWFDDGIGPRTLNMQLDYYWQAIQNINTSAGGTKIFVFSDKPERAQFLLKPILDDYNWALINLGEEDDNSINEFWLMSHCKQIIISNSTFAWWAAWLGEANGNTSKIVAPGRKIEPIGNVTAWGFPRLLPARWTII